MRSWSDPSLPKLSQQGPIPRIHDTASGSLVEVAGRDGRARMYVCGITPYDATHMGHAATYIAFDLLNRAWRNAGLEVDFVQNVTDVDDPLIERANATGVAWDDLAEREIALFRTDMEALEVLPPAHYIGVVESIDLVVDMVHQLQDRQATYAVEDDIYFKVASDPTFGEVSGYDPDTMTRFFAERGGDPDRDGKEDPLDALVWKAERPDDPAWDSALGRGRPGWHIECSAIARHYLGTDFDVQGGGSDLIFPHHEMSAAHAQVAEPGTQFARSYVHSGMVGYQGEKMSKSKGNLVLVSKLRADGVDPRAIRLALLAHHYRSDWEWFDEDRQLAEARLERWQRALSGDQVAPADQLITDVLAALANDLDAPSALTLVDEWAERSLAGGDQADHEAVRTLLAASLGVSL